MTHSHGILLPTYLTLIKLGYYKNIGVVAYAFYTLLRFPWLLGSGAKDFNFWSKIQINFGMAIWSFRSIIRGSALKLNLQSQKSSKKKLGAFSEQICSPLNLDLSNVTGCQILLWLFYEKLFYYFKSLFWFQLLRTCELKYFPTPFNCNSHYKI